MSDLPVILVASTKGNPMSNFYDTACEICACAFDIDDVMKVTYTDLSEKVFCYSCISPEQENEDNTVMMISTWIC